MKPILGVLSAAAILAASATAGCAADRPAFEAVAQWDEPADVRLLKRGRYRGWPLGGLSALDWDEASGRLVALSDRGQAFALPITPDQRPEHLARLNAPRRMRDAEALRRAPGQGWHVVFEDENAIAFYRGDADAMGRRPERVMVLPRKDGQEHNAGVESLALLDFGRLLAIAEGGPGDRRGAWIVDGGAVVERTYACPDGFSPVDAVATPLGDVLVLERRFNGLAVPFFNMRIARIPAASIDAATGALTVSARIDLAPGLPSENWEGMAIVPARSGPDLWLVSDDNLQWPQHTLLARLPLAGVLAKLGAR